MKDSEGKRVMGVNETEMDGIIKWNNDIGSIRFWPSEIKTRACEQMRAGVSDIDPANCGALAR